MASDYHWSQAEILDTLFLDEAHEYLERIKTRKLSQYAMLVNIVHTENPQEFVQKLYEESPTRQVVVEQPRSEEFDRNGMLALMGKMKSNPRMVIKDPR